MSIASEISRLSGVREDIFTSITNKGVTVPETATFSSCPSLIDSITGGGSAPTSYYNTNYTPSAIVEYEIPYTATQKATPVGIPTTTSFPFSSNYFGADEGGWVMQVSSLSALASGNFSATIVINGEVGWEGGYYANKSEWDCAYCDSSPYPSGSFEENKVLFVITPNKFEELFNEATYFHNWNLDDVIALHPAAWQSYKWETYGTPSAYFEGIEITGYEYPYPDRPMEITGVWSGTGCSLVSADYNGYDAYKNSISSNFKSITNSQVYTATNNPFEVSFQQLEIESRKKDNDVNGKDIFVSSTDTIIDTVAPNSAYNFSWGNESTASTYYGNFV